MRAFILAAGRSTRMGRQKLLMPFGDGNILDRVIRAVLSCAFQETVVVTSQETLAQLTRLREAEYLVNPDPDRGQDSSLRCVLEARDDALPFALFLGDKPLITVPRITALRRRFLALPLKTALVPRKDGAPGHPAFYAPLWRERFLNATESARSVLFRHADEVEWAEWTEACEECFFDVDTPEDYRRLPCPDSRADGSPA